MCYMLLKVIGNILMLCINVWFVYIISKDRIRKYKIDYGRYELVTCNVLDYKKSKKIKRKSTGTYGYIEFEYQKKALNIRTRSREIFKRAMNTKEVIVFMNMYNPKDYTDGKGYVSCKSNKTLLLYTVKLILGVCIQSALL